MGMRTLNEYIGLKQHGEIKSIKGTFPRRRGLKFHVQDNFTWLQFSLMIKVKKNYC